MTLAWTSLISVTSGDPVFRFVMAILMAAAILAFAMAVLLISGDKRSELEKRLTGFSGDEAGPDPNTPAPGARADRQLTETRLMEEMVGFTGRLADRVGLLQRVEDKLVQADLPLRPPEAIFFYLAGVFVVLVGSALVFGVAAAFVFTMLASVIPVAWLTIKAKRRLRSFEAMLPDVLNLLSGSMRAGFSFAQGLEAVAEEASEPARRELQRVFAESRLGRPIEDALEDSANRMHSVDLMWAVMAIRIQREVGGNLAELLDTVARTMTERERMKREIFALTAEGRLSAIIMGIFPPAFAGILFLIQPKYMSMLFASTLGVMAVIGSAIMAFFGFLWLRKIIAIEV
jgi:tight adherence protein B